MNQIMCSKFGIIKRGIMIKITQTEGGGCMKSKLYRSLLAIIFAFSLFAITGSAEAYCTKVPTHWVNGYKVPTHTVCSGKHYQYGHCKWIPGHWRDGYYHEGHRACTR